MLPRNLPKALTFPVSCALCLAFTGCALLTLKKEDLAIQNHGFVMALVEEWDGRSKSPLYVVLLSDGTVSGVSDATSTGIGTFAAPRNRVYDLLVFRDDNQNRVLDAGESSGILEGVQPVPLSDPGLKPQVHKLRVKTRNSRLAGLALPDSGGYALRVALGEIAKPTDARFNVEEGEAGMWTPESSLMEGNLGLYFSKSYDPTKIPVVFVHGIGGSPEDFRKLIPALDTSRYQAWFFAYPSGFRLGKASTALATLMELALRRTGADQIHVVAHSMGGLVSRSAILKLAGIHGNNPVGKFVSISSPFGGDTAAKSGIRHLKYPVPSWIDMAPGSAFLTDLWNQKLPEPTIHYLLFGYDTKNVPWLTLNNDTVVNLQSTLFVPAQNESRKVFGLNKSHEAILLDSTTFQKVNEYLSAP